MPGPTEMNAGPLFSQLELTPTLPGPAPPLSRKRDDRAPRGQLDDTSELLRQNDLSESDRALNFPGRGA